MECHNKYKEVKHMNKTKSLGEKNMKFDNLTLTQNMKNF